MSKTDTFTKRLSTAVINRFLKLVPDGRIKVEAAVRSEDPISGKITVSPVSMKMETFTSWKNAVQNASNPEDPDRNGLVQNYQSLMYDCHLMACMDTRILKVQRSRFKVVNAAGETNEELTNLLKRGWMDDFIREAMMSRFIGCNVIELMELDENLEIKRCTAIPQLNVKPKFGLIVKEPGDTTGWNYKEGVFANYYIQAGDFDDLGIFKDLGPVVIAKKMAIGAWLDYIDKLAIPPRWVVTESNDKKRHAELYAMMSSMLSCHYAVLQGTEKIEFANVNAAAAKDLFDTLIERDNSEMSKRILGATGTMDEKSFVGAALVHQQMAFERHESDKVWLGYLINKELFKRLPLISSVYKTEGMTFMWDDSYEMTPEVLIDKAVALAQHFELDTEDLTKRTGITILGPKTDSGTQAAPTGKKP
ncbi:MAG: hypothetical protein U0T77_10680 [Chitinophagales bacterium]